MKNADDTETDGARLQRMFDALKAKTGMKKAEFARDFKIPGGASMISQHISGHRPISLDAMVAYAKGFKCSVADISPTLAASLLSTPLYTEGSNQALTLVQPMQAAIGLEDAVRVLADAISASPARGSDVLIGALTSLAKDPDRLMHRQVLAAIIAAPDQSSQQAA